MVIVCLPNCCCGSFARARVVLLSPNDLLSTIGCAASLIGRRMLIEVKDHGPYGGIGMSGRVNPVVRILFCEARRLRNQRLGDTALQRFGQEVPRTPGFSPLRSQLLWPGHSCPRGPA